MPNLYFKQKNFILFYAFFAILLLLHFYVFSTLKILDYDSIHNFQVLEEINKGDWHNLFHHGSPVFYLFYSCFYLAFKDINSLFIINLLVSYFSIILLIKTFQKNSVVFLIWLSSSLFIFTCGHYFSIESLSLLCNSILWYQIYLFLEKKDDKKLTNNALLIGFWGVITLLVNYKFIVVLPLMGLSLWTIRKEVGLNNTLFIKVICLIFLGIIIPIVVLMFLGIILGLPWYQYPATLYSIFSVSKNTNPTSTELSYYFFYFFHFENIGIIILLIIRVFLLKKIPSTTLEKFIFIVFFGVFIVMSFLPKAPRGLIFILPLVYVWIFKFSEKLQHQFIIFPIRKVLWFGFFWGTCAIQFYRIYENLYPYKYSYYPLIAQYLKQQNTNVIFTTLGMGVYPYLDKSIKMEVLREISDTVKFQQFTGKKYLLYDAFCEVAGHQSLYALKQKKAILSYPEKSLLAPSLFLEHSEYNGLSFKESLELQKGMQQQKYQLILIPLP